MQIVDPTTHRVYYVIDSGLLAELERRSDLDAIRSIGQQITLDVVQSTSDERSRFFAFRVALRDQRLNFNRQVGFRCRA